MRSLIVLCAADLSAMAPGVSPLTKATRLLVHPRMRAVLMFRMAHACYVRPHLRPLALLISARILRSVAAEIGAGATIGPGFTLVHTTGLVIGHNVVAGSGLVVHQGVTIGDRRADGAQPTIGDRVVLGAGASVLGNVVLGDDVSVAAGAVVLTDVPAGSVAAGVPARVQA